MSEYIARTLPFIQVLAKSKPQIQKAIFQYGPPDLILAISEIVLNALKGVIRLTSRQKRYLTRYKEQLRALVKRNVSLKKKRKFLVQEGRGAVSSILVPLALSILLKNQGISV